MTSDVWDRYPCPTCGELGHRVLVHTAEPGEPICLHCPYLPPGVRLIWVGGTFIRDNREQFKPKQEVSDKDWPEFTDDHDFFEANQTIEI